MTTGQKQWTVPDEVSVGQTSMCPLVTADNDVSMLVHAELSPVSAVNVGVDFVDENQSTLPPNTSVTQGDRRK